MVEATTDRVRYAYAAEDTFGTAKTGSGVYRYMRATGDSLVTSTSVGRSGELRGDAQIVDWRRMNVGVAGAIPHELCVDAGIEAMIEAALRSSAFATPAASINTTISITDSNTIADSGAGLGGLTVGQMILLYGFSNPANNTICKVASVSAGSIDVVEASLVAESAGAAKTLQPGVSIANTAVTTASSFTIEREQSDISSDFKVWRGMTVNGFTVAMTQVGFVTIAFDFMGKDEIGIREGETGRPTSSQDSGTIIAAGTAAQFTCPENTRAVLEASTEFDVVDFSLTFSRNLRSRQVATEFGPKSMGEGTHTVTGTLSMLYEDSTQVDKFLQHTETGFVLKFRSGSSAYAFEVPACYITESDDQVSGQDADIQPRYSINARKETSGAGNMIRVWAFA